MNIQELLNQQPNKTALLNNLYKAVETKKGDGYLISEKTLAEKYNVTVDEIIAIEKEAILFETDILDTDKRRRIILNNLDKNGLDYYKENEGGLKSDFTDAIIVNSQGQILFLVRNSESELEPKKHCLPGGHLEKVYENNIKRNIIKEVKEETGLDLLSQTLIGIKNIANGKKIYYFYCKYPIGQNVVLNEREHVNYHWMSLEEIEKMPDDDFIYDLKQYLLTLIKG